MDGKNLCLAVPEEKRTQALHWLNNMICKKKATVRQLQSLAGTLNFLCKAVYPGRVFTRRMYAKFSFSHDLADKSALKSREKKLLKPFHHVRLDSEFHSDCRVWVSFLSHQHAVNRPFIDMYKPSVTSTQIDFYTDSSLNPRLGFGCSYFPEWTFCQWEADWILQNKPSITYLEFYALCVAVFLWKDRLSNMRVTVFCDNTGVRDIVNLQTSGCKNCMYLLRLLTVNNLLYNRRLFVEYVSSKDNDLADALSRLKIKYFLDNAPDGTKRIPERIPEELWPISKIWQN